jgi:hypothetical protein
VNLESHCCERIMSCAVSLMRCTYSFETPVSRLPRARRSLLPHRLSYALPNQGSGSLKCEAPWQRSVTRCILLQALERWHRKFYATHLTVRTVWSQNEENRCICQSKPPIPLSFCLGLGKIQTFWGGQGKGDCYHTGFCNGWCSARYPAGIVCFVHTMGRPGRGGFQSGIWLPLRQALVRTVHACSGAVWSELPLPHSLVALVA